ncbi:MAG: hypothetical protein ABW224_10775 [Kibdelosporangium sp.]
MRCVSLAVAALAVMAGLSPVAASATVVPVPCVRTVSANDITKAEGTAEPGVTFPRPTNFTFTVSSTGCARSGGVMYKVLSLGTETNDHSWPSDVLWWDSGEAADKKVTVAVNRDDDWEPHEKFEVHMCPSTGVVIGSQGIGTILNDDGFTLPPADWSPTFHCPQVVVP